MVHHSKLVLAVKVNNTIVKEYGDKAYIPFNSEYSLFLKNLNSKAAIMHISIDGKDVVSGGLMIDANQTIDLERFVSDHNTGNRFKFIERTDSVEKHRGIGAEDGLIRIEYQFAKSPTVYRNPVFVDVQNTQLKYNNPVPAPYSLIGSSVNNPLRSREAPTLDNKVITSSVNYSAPANEAGITVAGSISNQKFDVVEDFPLEVEKHVIVMHLVGQTEDNKPVKKVQASRAKPKCTTCGRVNKSSAKFCTECGTSLTIID